MKLMLHLPLHSEWCRSKSTTDCASTLGAASSEGPISPLVSLPLGLPLVGDQTAHGQKPVLPTMSSRMHAMPYHAIVKHRALEDALAESYKFHHGMCKLLALTEVQLSMALWILVAHPLGEAPDADDALAPLGEDALGRERVHGQH